MKVIAIENITLDGVMQAPARPDEDRRGGFDHGGWSVPYVDGVLASEMVKRMSTPGALLLGRRTYDDLYGFWPNQPANPYTESLNNRQKYVASRSRKEPLPWQNSTLLRGDAAAAVADLKKTHEDSLVIIGSGELVQALMRHNLIDEYVISIFPVVLGSGRRLFSQGVFASLRLVDSITTTTGVVMATYAPAEASANHSNGNGEAISATKSQGRGRRSRRALAAAIDKANGVRVRK